MLLPLKDNLPTLRFPLITVLLIVINVGVYVWQTSYSDDQVLARYDLSAIDQSSVVYGAIPARLMHPGSDDCAISRTPTRNGVAEDRLICESSPGWDRLREQAEVLRGGQPLNVREGLFKRVDQPPWFVTVFTSMFMHGGILHIAFNMLFLWVFGNNIEDSMGRLKFIAFYLLAGIAAVYSQSAIDPSSTVPTIGASGAVAGVLGAYAVLHPRQRVLTLLFIVIFVTFVEIPAMILLGIWFALQFLPAVGQVATSELDGGGVAYLAHVGGFLFGMAAIKLFARRRSETGPELPAA